jgi:hypothetical protein
VKRRGVHAHGYLHDKTFVDWECENTEIVQQVYEMVVQTRPSSEVWDGINNVHGIRDHKYFDGINWRDINEKIFKAPIN